VSCFKAGVCDPKVCLCKKGAPPQPLKSNVYESTPNVPNIAVKAAQEESYAENMATNYFKTLGTKGHLDKVEKEEKSAGMQAVETANKMATMVEKAQTEHKEAVAEKKEAVADEYAHKPGAEQKAAQKSWKNSNEAASAAYQATQAAGQTWATPSVPVKALAKDELPKGQKPSLKVKTLLENAKKLMEERNDKPPEETAEERLARHAAFAAEEAEEDQAHEQPNTDAFLQTDSNKIDLSEVEKAATSGAANIVEKARDYVKTARRMAAQGGAAIGVAEAAALHKIATRRKVVHEQYKALGVKSKMLGAKSADVLQKLQKEQAGLDAKKQELEAQAKAQRAIFKTQAMNEAKLAAAVSRASVLGKVEKARQKLQVEKAALATEVKVVKSIYTKEQDNGNRLKQEVGVVSKAEQSALRNAERLGEAKARAMDQAHYLLAAREQKVTAHHMQQAQKWTRRHAAELGEVLVVTQALDKKIAQKKALLSQAKVQLKQSVHNLQESKHGDHSLVEDDRSIRESTEEMAREELGEDSLDDLGEADTVSTITSDELDASLATLSHNLASIQHQRKDLGESMQSKSLPAVGAHDSLGVDLAKMSANFKTIQNQIKTATKEEVQVEHQTMQKKQAKERNVKHSFSPKHKTHKDPQVKQQDANMKQQKALENKLAKEEAHLRSTTAKKIKAQYRLKNAVDEERTHKAKVAKQTSKNPITALTPLMETRLEYQRMYLQNAEQQAIQKRADLKNRLADIKEEDASRLSALTDDIRSKRKILKGDLNSISTLSGEYQRDHELGESLGEHTGLASIAKKEKNQEHDDIKTDLDVENDMLNLKGHLSHDHAQKEKGLLENAHKVLTATEPRHEKLGEADKNTQNSQTKLGTQLAEARTGLQLKMTQFESLRKQELELVKQADHTHKAAHAAEARESEAEARTDAMTQIANRLGDGIDEHEQKMELSESFFSTKKEDDDLGESSETAPELPPVQAELNAEQEELARAQAQIAAIAKAAPKLVHDQVATDKKELGQQLEKQNANLNKLHTRFVRAAKQVSPQLTSQSKLDEAVQDEKDIQDRYSSNLRNIGAYANLVDKKAEEAAAAAGLVH